MSSSPQRDTDVCLMTEIVLTTMIDHQCILLTWVAQSCISNVGVPATGSGYQHGPTAEYVKQQLPTINRLPHKPTSILCHMHRFQYGPTLTPTPVFIASDGSDLTEVASGLHV